MCAQLSSMTEHLLDMQKVPSLIPGTSKERDLAFSDVKRPWSEIYCQSEWTMLIHWPNSLVQRKAAACMHTEIQHCLDLEQHLSLICFIKCETLKKWGLYCLMISQWFFVKFDSWLLLLMCSFIYVQSLKQIEEAKRRMNIETWLFLWRNERKLSCPISFTLSLSSGVAKPTS